MAIYSTLKPSECLDIQKQFMELNIITFSALNLISKISKRRSLFSNQTWPNVIKLL